jgi:hypothetical protein
MKCKLCNKNSEHLELHHIIPKSRGGKDAKENLIKICSDCHGKAHDVSFVNDRGGLVKEGQNKKRNEVEEAKLWLDNNVNLVDKFFDDLYNKDPDKHMLFLLLMETNKVSPATIKEYCEFGRVSFKAMFTF